MTLLAKVMLQELCRRRCGCDDNIPADISHQWTGWLEDLKSLASFKVERCIKPKHFGQPIKAQLHNFSDASEDGFGTVTYLRIKKRQEPGPCLLLAGKSKSHLPETDNYFSSGAYSCCTSRPSRSDVESRIGAATGSVNFLDG